jgi:hypothetical protein
MEMNNIIAKRSLILRYPNGESQSITACIGMPQRDMKPGGDWCCHIDIQGLPGNKLTPLYGIDSVQVLLFSLRLIPVILDNYARNTGATLDWLESGTHGFPNIEEPK